MSHGLFAMAAGDHAITIAPSADGFGAGYLIVESAEVVPEPATLVLLGTGTAVTFWRTRRRRQR